VPGAGLAGICGVESGKAAPLVGGPPGVELHTVVDALPSMDTGEMVPVVLPSTDTGDMVPVVLPTMDVAMAPKGAAGAIVAVLLDGKVETVPGIVDDVGTGVAAMEGADGVDIAGVGAGTVEPGIVDMNDVAGCADNARIGAVVDVGEPAGIADVVGAGKTDDVVPVVPPIDDIEVTGTVGVPGAICPDGVEQVTAVPGVVGSEASGTGISVVSGTPGWVTAENGLGPESGEDSIVPGVDERPIAVVPMVETCARQTWQPDSRTAAVNSKCRIAIPSSPRRPSLSALCAPSAPQPLYPRPDSPPD
jgi:hypothetical protein